MARRNGGFVGQDGLDAPDPPTGISASAGEAAISISFTAPTDAGTSAITGFIATAGDGSGATGTSSPITISSLSNGTAYTARVYAINAYGTSAASDASSSVTPAAARALFAGGTAPGNVIDYVTVSSTGNASDFGDLTVARLRGGGSGAASTTRGVFGGGTYNSTLNVIDYVTIASTGNATDFGNLTVVRYDNPGFSNSTRGIWAGASGNSGAVNTIDYITIASTGNATDFGDRSVTGGPLGGFASSTRGVTGGAPSGNNVIDYVTIASTGNSTDFGNLTAGGNYGSGCSSGTRGVFFGGYRTSSVVTMDYVTIASTGNATDFGDLQSAPSQNSWGTSSSTRGLCAATFGTGTDIQYITIANTGNSTDFGNLTDDRHLLPHQAVSSGHGGLQ